MALISLIFFLLLVGAILWLQVNNPGGYEISLGYRGYRLTGQLWEFLASAGALGLLLGFLMMAPGRLRQGRRARQYLGELRAAQAALDDCQRRLQEAASKPPPQPEGGDG